MNAPVSSQGSTQAEALAIVNRLVATRNDVELLQHLEGVGKDEFALMGELVQVYCSADALCRGLIAILRKKREGSASDFAFKLVDADVLIHMRKEAQQTILSIDTVGIISAIEILEMHRDFRHTFSHWVVKKYRAGNYLVAFTKNKKEGENRDGIALTGGQAKLMVFPVAELLIELDKLKGHCEFLAELHQYME
ncbi:hypothetical protein [Pseudomonas sp. BP8]|uniref:hypothetical protein n=1 Tax=Pseudomonas sp. BP8 TaxID=2817864 RepID=UPI001AE92BAD|nr:hypothetical protein [Pseudomonas sp. BP8]MBP2262291.1 hypothetical protein [Pseudomonas sp. BP8]HDS1733214.1 hypothetical protein [Pseudomonas putida]